MFRFNLFSLFGMKKYFYLFLSNFFILILSATSYDLKKPVGITNIVINNICKDSIINIKNMGAKGDGITDDWKIIERAVTILDDNGGGIIYFPKGVYIVGNAISLKSNITYRGESKTETIIKASNSSLDNVFGQGYPLYLQWKKARKVGGTIDRLKKPDFISNYSEDEAFSTGGMAGLAITNVKIENLTIDGNKDKRQENKVNFKGVSEYPFFAGEKISSTSGGKAIISGVFNGDDGFSVEPRTIEGVFKVGDRVKGEESGSIMTIKGKKADDAYQMLIRFDGVSHSVVKNCILKNSIFTALSIYNNSNNNKIINNEFYNNNKSGTDFTWGRINIFVEFDARKNIIENNIIKGGLGYSVFVQSTGGMNYDTQIINNKIYNPGGDGIRVGNETSISPIINPIIIGNTVIGAQGTGAVGIRIIHYGEGTISGGIISENTVKNCIYGILLQGRVEKTKVTGNIVSGSKKVNVGSTATFNNNIIKDN
ncbi:right-handed parallel beta-helix repeat-containing protein [Elizabethkingia anophelis]|uniref:right-handed parallel beta-helix repeat-containing protein n=1 Tax=Elizabethkingia anophelis TaxID=1117645 RepID=UPI001EE69D15|nr:right-handed parallel beta-helix repeat-containing protein [Elizabethkingia anophelis]UKY87649.1 right-handed parallel beta-helix repeat-containing protein [Elizabethkingia anophelis]UKZ01759.1 right-handed parallel beta-helix repeat-containing protein [Elizabethkingia anophelis]